jgi:prepilin-type N-terminal cleavage/methylation domain-containing protein/prepilin-type processing-associated H-X9-DG protein
MDRRGFTLIELLVVIAIIAILAAILFPVFARAREKARQTQCLSNVKEITLAFEMYKQDYDSFGPQRDITAGSIRLAWTDFLQPYIKNTQLFLCPSTQSPHSPWNTRVPTDYGYNFCRVRNTPESQIHRPAEYGVFFDWRYACIKDNGVSCGCGAGGGQCVRDHGWRPTDLPPHNEGINIGYYDGHAKWLKASEVQDRLSRNQLPIWNEL